MNELVQDKFRRLIRRYPEVFRGKRFDKEEFKRVFDKTQGYGNLTVFYYDKDIIHYIIASIVIRESRYMDINFMNAYQLIDIYLGKVEEVPCLSIINNEVVAVYDGVGMPNKQKGNILIQIIEQQRMAGKKFWLFYKGTPAKLSSMYPEVMEILRDDNFTVVSFNGLNRSSVVEEDEF